jgi:hypothetical protein
MNSTSTNVLTALLALILAGTSNTLRAEPVEWDFTALTSIPQTIWSHVEKGAKITISRDSEIESTLGRGALKIAIDTPSSRKIAYDIQVNFTKKTQIIDGKNYRITLLCKSSSPAHLEGACFATKAPYAPFGHPSKFSFDTDAAWKELAFEFVGVDTELADLRLFEIPLGAQPEGFVLWIARLKFEEL